MSNTKFSNPTSANPGVGNPMTPSPSSEPVKGSANRAGSPSSTTRDTKSSTGEGPDHLKESPKTANISDKHSERKAG